MSDAHLYVPVHQSRLAAVIRTGRLPQGERVGIAFTSLEHLAAAMGDRQPWTRLAESALRSMLRPLGVNRIQVDPILVAPDISMPVAAGV
ncbi:hypothetical protein Afil01_42740 [Actinorhabdospora filicis]|uniref:SseB protein N-terminal domain-containing protein n=1 Tax=Actinorhabdospora filicis TaxID=1785913 RepID=A0A9W6SP26_9ACTN|nr:SAV_915 family protein [Actinorhabdospora filicis]GLZ79467.1 hypothetical protein Afil01_42740 [Actinorhabdospora filicis]